MNGVFRKCPLVLAIIGGNLCLTATAAELSNFPPTSTPYGYVAPVTVKDYNISDGASVVYRPWFHQGDDYGDLKAHTISSAGVIAAGASWSAKSQLDAMTFSNRQVFTYNGSSAVDYGCGNNGSTDLVKFICGDNSNEVANSGSYRDRESDLGDIVHSNPIYVGHPQGGYTFDDYLAFADAWDNRSGMVYAGANDGMLHGFNASTGAEVFAYIPSPVSGNLTNLSATASSSPAYAHQYYVDGPLTVADAYANFDGSSGKEWRTILVGTLGAGGRGIFAIDVTDPSAANRAALSDTMPSPASPATKFLWEYNSSSNSNLGYTYSKPVVAQIKIGTDKHWAVIVGNGYHNNDGDTVEDGDGKAHLLILPVKSGEFTAIDIPLGTSTSNGLSSPAAIDSDNDNVIDTVYAGDLDGNLWKVDISDASISNWGADVDYSDSGLDNKPLFTATDANGYAQPIVTVPQVAKSTDGYLTVAFGSADNLASSGYLSSSSAGGGFDASLYHQSIYGIRDYGITDTVTPSAMQLRTVTAISGQTEYRTASANSDITWSTPLYGWKINLAANEHLQQDPIIRDYRLQMMISDITSGSEKNWLTQVDFAKGGLPAETVFDLDGDGDLDSSDDISSTRVVAVNRSADLASGPVIVRSGAYDHSLVNLWHEQTISTAPGAATCSMLWVDLRYQIPFSKDKSPSDSDQVANGTHSITFKGYLDDGSTIDMKISNLKFKEDAVYNKGDCDADAMCVHGGGGVGGGDKIDLNFNRPNTNEASLTTPNGNGADGTTGALGLRWDPSHIDLHRSNESFAIGIQFHSNLRLDNYSLEFDWTGVVDADGDGDTQFIRRVEVGTGTCGGSFDVGDARLIKDGATENTQGGIASWDTANQKLTINNPDDSTLVFNDGGDSAAEVGGGAGVVVDGTTDQTTQNGDTGPVGRIRWRELLF